jgi:hypothetical protein
MHGGNKIDEETLKSEWIRILDLTNFPLVSKL